MDASDYDRASQKLAQSSTLTFHKFRQLPRRTSNKPLRRPLVDVRGDLTVYPVT